MSKLYTKNFASAFVRFDGDDVFEIHPSKLKMVKDETEEERILRLQKEAEWKEKYGAEKEKRKAERSEKRAEWKEEILKRRYKDDYVSKEERLRQAQSDVRQAQSDVRQAQSDGRLTIDDEQLTINEEMEIVLDSNAVDEISTEEIPEKIIAENSAEDINLT